MASLHIMDTSALLAVEGCCKPSCFPELLIRMRELIDDGSLRFPKAVVAELIVLGREELITAWAIGLGKALKPFSADVENKWAVMRIFQLEMGYDSGLEDIDGSEPAIVDVTAIGHMLAEINLEFWIISEDRGSAPLRPTMEEVCRHKSWNIIGVQGGLKSLGLDDFVIE